MAMQANTMTVPFGAVAVLRAVNVFQSAVEAVRDWNNQRQTLKALSGLSDHQLADIGLNRGDLI